MTATAGDPDDPAPDGQDGVVGSTAPEPVRTSEPVRTPEPVRTSEPVRTPEPVRIPEPARTPEPAQAPEPAGSDAGRVTTEAPPNPWYRLLPGSSGDAGGCLLIATEGEQVTAGAWRLASGIPREPGRLSIVMMDAPVSLMPELARQLHRWVPDRWDTVRLVANRSGAPQATGTPAAQELAERLGVEVLAPEGDVVVVPGGSLFVFDPVAPNARPGWVRFRPMRSPRPAGRRVPTPDWEAGLALLGEPGITGVTVSEIPAGLWAYPTGPPPRRLSRGAQRGTGRVRRAVILGSEQPRGGSPAGELDLAYAVPRAADTVTLVVSRPGETGPTSAALGQLLSALPDTVLERLVVLPYGDRPIADGSLGAAVSRATNRTVRVGNGLPLYVPGQGRQVTAIDADGVPTWRPFARDLVWRPQGGARVVRWTAPVDHLLPVAHGRLAIDEWWVVEIIESGLWIRQRDASGPGWLVRELPLDARYCNIVIGTPSAIQIAPPWRPIARLLRNLPSDARRRVRILVPWGAGAWVARAARRSLARGLGGGSVWVLRPDGILGPRVR